MRKQNNIICNLPAFSLISLFLGLGLLTGLAQRRAFAVLGLSTWNDLHPFTEGETDYYSFVIGFILFIGVFSSVLRVEIASELLFGTIVLSLILCRSHHNHGI